MAGVAGARTPKGSTAKHTPAGPPQITITNITATSITFSDDNSTKTVNVTPFTEVIVNGQKGTMNDLKTGMVVNVALRDPSTASRITATGTGSAAKN